MKQLNYLKNTWYNNYNLNEVVSVLTRLNTPWLTNNDLIAINHQIENCISLIDKNNIDIVNSNIEHKNAVIRNVDYILWVSSWLQGKFPILDKNLLILVGKLYSFADRLKNNQFSLETISQQSISEVFEFDWLFVDAEEKSRIELVKRDALVHPDKSKLSAQLSMWEAERITNFAITQLFETQKFPVNFHKEDDFGKHIIYWNKSENWVNYMIPPFKIDEYLSFDLPHNATHLLHLYRLQWWVETYVDEMTERCFFEALAVLSEHLAVTSLMKSKELSNDLFSCLEKSNKKKLSKQEFQDFVVNDRKFEFRLRAVRLIADILIVNWYTYEEVVNQVVDIVWVDKVFAENEVKKYIAQPWLWAIYTLWYNKMLELGVNNPTTVIDKTNPPKTWRQFLHS